MANDPETTAFNDWVERAEHRGERAAFSAGWEAANRFERFVNGTTRSGAQASMGERTGDAS